MENENAACRILVLSLFSLSSAGKVLWFVNLTGLEGGIMVSSGKHVEGEKPDIWNNCICEHWH